jgi:NADH:ubiquinone oxidoreductase subunit 2 (subunit N)
VIQAALQAPTPQVRLVVVLVLASVISAGYYMYVVLVMFMKPRREVETIAEPRMVGSATKWVIGLSTVILLVLGVYPDALVSLTQRGSAYLHSPAPQISQVYRR